ncbi:MAG: Wzz/FepE/Etk N-terminal domain-containing protein, partial [Candidatus Dadabacteria bacterium]|nr:Wzz/FepE/Etk N-terminal domain-containing protein [Candidatus Dadabacteria bacterium]
MTFRILQYLLRKRKAVWAFTLAVAVIALAVVLIADAPYRSEALLMPPLEEGSEGLLGAWMAQLNLPSMVIPMSAGSQTAAITVDILQSRRLAEIVIDRLDLKAWYKTESMHKAVDNLQDAMSIQASTTGMISMKVTDRDPEMALRIAKECIN